MEVLIHNYPLYIAVWLAVSLFTLFIFRVIPKKMKQVEDKETKNSLFTIMIFIGLPLLLIAVLGPMVFIVGDAGMDMNYKLVWGGLILVFLLYFFMKQRSKP
jgi:Na+/proline symporter